MDCISGSSLAMKTLILNGNRFSDLPSFYEEINLLFTKNLDWKLGHSLDALHDILYGGFGIFEPKEEIILIWQNHEKSKKDLGMEPTKDFYESKIEKGYSFSIPLNRERLNRLFTGEGKTLYEIIIEIINDHKDINLVLD